jgi:hypothetical protein
MTDPRRGGRVIVRDSPASGLRRSLGIAHPPGGHCPGWNSCVAALALAVTACGGGDSTPAPPTVAIDVAAINALVPAGLRSTLVFEQRQLDIDRGPRKTTYTLAAPRGWVARGTVSARLRPATETGVLAHLEVSANCDGACTPKPWETIADKINFATRPKRTVLKDDKAPGRRTMIVEAEHVGTPTTDVIVAWWTDGARNYHTCKASLGDPIREAAPAFAAACQSVAIDGDD